MLLLGWYHEVVEKLRSGHFSPATQVDVVGNVGYHVYDLFVLVKLQSLLREIPEAYRLAYVKLSSVRRHESQEHFHKGGFACAVVSDNAHFLEPGEIVVEVVQDDFLPSVVLKLLGNVLALEYFRPDVHVAGLQAHLPVFYALLGFGFKLVEGLFAVSCFVPASLWHAAHPLQLGAVEIVGPCDFRPLVVYPLLAFLQVIAVVAPVGVDALIRQFEDDVAHMVEEVAVVGHHEQGEGGAAQISLQPDNHLKVQMVGRLVKQQKVGVVEQGVGQGHPLLLTAAQLSHGLLQVGDVELRQDLLGPQDLFLIALMVEASVKHRLFGVELRRLLQVANLQSVAPDDGTALVALVSGENGHECRFSRSVMCDEAHFLSFRDRE